MSDASFPSLGKKILGLFIETEESRDETGPAPAPAKAAPATLTVVTGTGVPAASNAVARPGAVLARNLAVGASVDPEMLATLQKKISARSTPYITLMDTAQRLVGIIPDETTRLKAAFAMVCGDGNRSAASIAQAIDVHLADLEGERIRFKNVSNDQLVGMAADLRKQANALTAQGAASSAEIERMQAAIASLQGTMSKNTAQARELTAAADKSEADIKAVCVAFDRAVEYLKNDLAGKKAALNALLA